jgi:hypothetical protein
MAILIVHLDRKTQRTVQRILGATGYHVEVADDLDVAMRLLEHFAPRLVVVDGSALSSPLAAAFFAALRARHAEACMMLLGARTLDQVPHLLELRAITNLLVHPMPVLAEELTITAHKLVRNDLFGAEKYLLWGTELHERIVTHSAQRLEIVSDLGQAIRAGEQSARTAAMARLVADELISNAVHNAPCDAAGNHYRSEVARDTDLELDPAHQVRLRWGCDARYFAIEVTDYFGSLDRGTILSSLAKQEIRDAGGGAGMGVVLSYRSCDHLIFNLAPGKRTEVIALFDVRSGPTDATRSSASFNVFVENSS